MRDADILQSALSIRQSRDTQELVEVMRMAVDASQAAQNASLDAMMDRMETMGQQTLQAQERLLEAMAAMLSQVETLARTVAEMKPEIPAPIVNVPQLKPRVSTPKATVTLEQQPVTVNVPESKVEVTPQISVPETQVVIESKQLTKANIIHADGSFSRVEFS